MGEVWAGEHLAIGMKVAIKTLLAAAAYDREVVARFRREANLLGRIRSDHVARVVDFIEDPQAGLVLVMEFIDGSPLSKILHQRRLGVEEAIDVGCDVTEALVALHRAHVIHRDMKPGNIIMEPTATGKQRAIIVDFGMGRIAAGAGEDLEQTNLTRADMALGTLEYMAPEQILNSRDVTAGSDLYAVGAMLYRAVAGRHIFGDAQDADLARAKLMTDAPALQTGRNDRISQGFVQVVMRAVTKSPRARYQKADDMLNELRALQDAVRAQAFEQSTARHLLAPASLSQPNYNQTQPLAQHHLQQQQQPYGAQPSAQQTPMPQQQPQQHHHQRTPQPSHPNLVPGQELASMAGGPVSGVSGSMSAAAPVSVPVNNQRRGMSTGAVLALVFFALLVGAGSIALIFRDKLTATAQPGTAVTTQPAANPPPPAATPTPAPTPSAAPTTSVAKTAEPEPMVVEPPAPPPAPTQTFKPVGTASTTKSFGTSSAPVGTNKVAPTTPNIKSF